jgi:hypothetical protein
LESDTCLLSLSKLLLFGPSGKELRKAPKVDKVSMLVHINDYLILILVVEVRKCMINIP